MKAALTILFAMTTGLGWAWTPFLKDKEWITVDTQIYIATGLTILFILQQIYLAFAKPESKADVDGRAPLIEKHLAEFIEKYYELIKDKAADPKPIVRANIMLPTLKHRGMFGKYLRIYYKTSFVSVYSPEEVELTWTSRQGLVGSVWSTGTASHFDADNQSLQQVGERLTDLQKKVTGHLKSVYCVPIYKNGQSNMVGIFSVDSDKSLKASFLQDPLVVELVQSFKAPLGALCPSEGVMS